MNKRWLMIGGSSAIIIVALIIIVSVIANQHKPDKTVDSFNEAVEEDDVDTLKELIKPDQKAITNKESLSAFVDYLQANNESFQVIKDGLEKQLDDEDFTSSNEQVSLIEDGKTMGMFPNYKLKVKTLNLKAKGHSGDDQIALAIDGFKKPLNKIDQKKEAYGPILPGEYTVRATVKNELGEFKKEEKKDVWGDSDVSFLIDNEELARNDKNVQKDIIDAINTFNDDVSVYVTSGFKTDSFTNGTKELRENLTGFDDNFDEIKEYVKQIESQFLGSTINMDEFELTQFDGDWQAEATALVSYDERIKLKEEKDFESASYTDLRSFMLKYDQEEDKWMIDDVISENADKSIADDWDNKEEVEIDDPPVRKWSKDDSDSLI